MLESYSPAITGSTTRLMRSWEDGMKTDIKEEMTKLSVVIAGKTLFNADVEKEAPEINQALDTATSLFGRIPLPFSEWLLKLPLPGTLGFTGLKRDWMI